jgi:hypothetical protein
MPFYDRIVSWFRARFGRRPPAPPLLPPVERIPPVIKIYAYNVTVSGMVLPPIESLRKKAERLDKDTVIQFELTFEDNPFFRTAIDKWDDAQKRFENELKELVKEQETRSMKSPRTGKPAFSYAVPSQENRKLLADYLEATSLEKRKMRKESPDEFASGRPSFMVVDVAFQEAGHIDVPSNRLREFKAVDEYYFAVYRPEDIEKKDPIDHWDGSFEHSLR